MLDFAKKFEVTQIPSDCRLIIQDSGDQRSKFNGAEKRQNEYLLSRACLAACCKSLDLTFAYDPSGINKKVVLPEELIHSLSHSKHVAAAIVGPKEKYLSMGIDLELQARPLTEKFITRITTPLERELINKYPAERLLVATIIFSAKEAVYKACSTKIDRFSYQNIEIWEEKGKLKAIVINQKEALPLLTLEYGFYKQTHLVTCLIIPRN